MYRHVPGTFKKPGSKIPGSKIPEVPKRCSWCWVQMKKPGIHQRCLDQMEDLKTNPLPKTQNPNVFRGMGNPGNRAPRKAML